mmetsp:Transcript_33112/g.72201  ORF Transcript_33112/g.72201 Transcript_33112/m.72201 type:complete len:271 (+) Transcript_33112:1255-2067(+)
MRGDPLSTLLLGLLLLRLSLLITWHLLRGGGRLFVLDRTLGTLIFLSSFFLRLLNGVLALFGFSRCFLCRFLLPLEFSHDRFQDGDFFFCLCLTLFPLLFLLCGILYVFRASGNTLLCRRNLFTELFPHGSTQNHASVWALMSTVVFVSPIAAVANPIVDEGGVKDDRFMSAVPAVELAVDTRRSAGLVRRIWTIAIFVVHAVPPNRQRPIQALKTLRMCCSLILCAVLWLHPEHGVGGKARGGSQQHEQADQGSPSTPHGTRHVEAHAE